MLDFIIQSNIEMKAERKFGIMFSLIFYLLGIYLYFAETHFSWWPFMAATILLAVSILKPSILIIPNILWLKLGLILGSIVTPVIMTIVYFSTVVPIGIIMKLLGKDMLQLKKSYKKKSYWIIRSETVGTMKDQF
jgi:hypothetical protein